MGYGHMGSIGFRREPEMNSSWKQAKLPGWGVRLLSSCLWAPKDWLFFKMEQEFWTLAFVLASLRTVGLSMAERRDGL